MDNDTCRVFVSYSREDSELVKKIVKTLEDNGLLPLWDQNFRFGSGFHEQIKKYIAYAHVFMPVLTEGSIRRGWVHQEIGYAMALNIPVLPVTKDQTPGGMLAQLLAVPLSEDKEKLRQQLSEEVFLRIVATAREKTHALFECAELRQDRTQMMIDYTESVLDLGYCGRVRQKGGLSSFHIPDKPVNDEVWRDRYGDHYDQHRCLRQRKERQALEKHARKEGCMLIVDPYIDFQVYGPKAKAARIRSLMLFLKSADKDLVDIVVTRPEPREHHVTIVGNWFSAEAMSVYPKTGILQTIFTRHGPTVQNRIEAFDEEFGGYLKQQGLTRGKTIETAIGRLKEELAK